MPENESGLFRKSTLERVSSPEQLNEYIKVTNPSLIIMLVGIFTILIAGVVLMFSGGIPKTVPLQGVVATDLNGEQSVYAYVPISTSKKIKENMAAQISIDYASREEYGYINGTVVSVGDEVVTEDTLRKKFSNPQIVVPAVSQAMQSGNVVQIQVSIGNWSTDKAKDIEITDGANCNLDVVVGETKGYQFIINTNSSN